MSVTDPNDLTSGEDLSSTPETDSHMSLAQHTSPNQPPPADQNQALLNSTFLSHPSHLMFMVSHFVIHICWSLKIRVQFDRVRQSIDILKYSASQYSAGTGPKKTKICKYCNENQQNNYSCQISLMTDGRNLIDIGTSKIFEV